MAIDLHIRQCFACSKIDTHKDSIAHEVCCKRCGSQDTRRITLKDCPFCGCKADLQKSLLKDRDYWTVGCQTRGCLGSVFEQTTAFPNEQFAKLKDMWNRRAGEKEC